MLDFPLERAGFEPSVPGESGFGFARPNVRRLTSGILGKNDTSKSWRFGASAIRGSRYPPPSECSKRLAASRELTASWTGAVS
jgi:hypothetical protein